MVHPGDRNEDFATGASKTSLEQLLEHDRLISHGVAEVLDDALNIALPDDTSRSDLDTDVFPDRSTDEAANSPAKGFLQFRRNQTTYSDSPDSHRSTFPEQVPLPSTVSSFDSLRSAHLIPLAKSSRPSVASFPPEEIALPASIASSRHSLLPEDIPLPLSSTPSERASVHERRTRIDPVRREFVRRRGTARADRVTEISSIDNELRDYRARRQRVAERNSQFPELGVEDRRSREPTTTVYFDYHYDSSLDGPTPASAVRPLRELPEVKPKLRCVLLEDLEPAKIDIVGAAFQLDVRFFGTHLRDSGYSNHVSEQSTSSNTWSAFQSTGQHCSIKWLRPVMPSLVVSGRLRDKLLSGRTARAPCVRKCDVGRHEVTTEQNIFRRALGLSASQDSADTAFPMGWEERITVSKVSDDRIDCDVLVVCLDPLPALQYVGSGHSVISESRYYIPQDVEAQPPPGLPALPGPSGPRRVSTFEASARRTRPSRTAPVIVPPPPPPPPMQLPIGGQNSLRDTSGPAGARDNGEGTSSIAATATMPGQRPDPRVPPPPPAPIAGARLALNIPPPPQGARPTFDLPPTPQGVRPFLDLPPPPPMPGFPSSGTTPVPLPPPPGSSRPARPSRTNKDSAKDASKAGIQRPRQVREIKVHRNFIPFNSIASRGPHDSHLDYDGPEGDDGKVPRPNSTLDLIIQSLSSHRLSTSFSRPSPDDVAVAMLQIIHHDTELLVEIVRASLQEINRMSVDMRPAQLQEHAQHWRTLLSRFQYELRQLLEKLPAFRDFFFRNEDGSYKADRPEHILPRVDETMRLLREALAQIDSAYGSLRAELQIADARRSIEEAENVARLTEIAFIFIPITLAASLFSMQIRELETPAPVGYFIATSLSLILLAYLVRLAVRNRAIQRYRSECFTMAREHAGLSDQEPLTTRQFVAWVGIETWQNVSSAFMKFMNRNASLIMLLIVAVLLSIPIIFLWRRDFDNGYASMMTVLIIAVDLGILYVVGPLLLSGWDPREIASFLAKPRHRTRKHHGGSSSSSNDDGTVHSRRSSVASSEGY